MARELDNMPEERAAQRVKDITDVMWHDASYVIRYQAFLAQERAREKQNQT